jgi:hypothetical protein
MQGETNDDRGMVITVEEEQPIIKVRPQRIMKVKKSKIMTSNNLNGPSVGSSGINIGVSNGVGPNHGRKSS